MIIDERPGRRLSEEEDELWRGVIRSVLPLKRRRSQPKSQFKSQSKSGLLERLGHRTEPHSPVSLVRTGEKKIGTSALRSPAPPVKPKSPMSPPQPLQLDRRTRQRIVRGTDAIDLRIDLHGRTQNDAHEALLRFLKNAQAGGAKTVLVITGKGTRDASHERGVLRRQVPLWLSLPEFRTLVLGIEDAHVSHGGEGALYVRLRKAR